MEKSNLQFINYKIMIKLFELPSIIGIKSRLQIPTNFDVVGVIDFVLNIDFFFISFEVVVCVSSVSMVWVPFTIIDYVIITISLL